jgi:hypothetical protein
MREENLRGDGVMWCGVRRSSEEMKVRKKFRDGRDEVR